MPKTNFPRSFTEAKARLDGAKSTFLSIGVARLSQENDCIRLIADDLPLVTFYADGVIKLCTRGRNHFSCLARINGAIPVRYCVRRRGSHVALIDKLTKATIAEFLTSTEFTPETVAISA